MCLLTAHFTLSPLPRARRSGRKINHERIFKAFRSWSFPVIQNRACFSYTHWQQKRAATLFIPEGRQFSSYDDADFVAFVEWVRRGASHPKLPVSSSALVYVTNSAGNTVDVIDTANSQVVQVIHDVD